MRRPFFGTLIITIFIALLVSHPAAAQGGNIAYGDIAQGAITAQSPLVLYNFQGNEGDAILIQVISFSSAFNPSVSLLSPTQQSLASSNSDIFNPISPDVRLDYSLPQAGVYSLLVGSEDGSSGDYLLRLFIRQTAATDMVPPDIPGEVIIPANALSQSFKLDATTSPPFTLSVTSQTADFTYLVEIRSSDQVVGLLTGMETVSLNLAPGDLYTVTLYALTPNAQGELIVNLSLLGPPDPVETPEVIPTEIPQGEGCSLTTAGNTNVNVRSAPDLDADPIGVLEPGQLVEVIGAQDGWYAITIQGVIGWVFGGAVTTSGDCENLGPIGSETPTSTPTTSSTPAETETAIASVTATATSTLESDQPTATLTTSTVEPTSTAVPSPTTTGDTATATASYTPTSTTAPPTATPSYTPTTPPPPPEAPEDPNFNSPLNIPLDSTTSVTDFVSYPGGDTEDRVRWDVSGMNPNSALSGGRARLIIAVSCFGTETQNVEFFTGGQTFSCGEAIVDREITYDSRTGQVTITAVAGQGTYVQWVLTGTATRLE